MLIAIVVGAIIGLVLAMPPGPIAMASIRMGLEKSSKEAFQMALGTASMDAIYCLVAMFATTAIESTVGVFLSNNPILTIAFQSLIIAALLYFGFLQLKKKKVYPNEINEGNNSNSATSNLISNLKSRGAIMLGLALSLTNIANPTFIPTLTVMSAWVHKMELFATGYQANLLFALGFGIGNFLWLYFLSIIVKSNKHRISDNYMNRIRQFAGLTFIGFGGIIGWRMLTFTNWSQVAKLLFLF